jgi:hypothetical protein
VRHGRAYQSAEVTAMGFEVVNEEGVVCGEPYGEGECHLAAQDAECLHAESGSRHKVVEVGTGEVFYETQGAPE